MSGVATRRAFLAAAQALVKTNAPDLHHYEAVTQSLAQIITDDTGVPCSIVLRCNATDLAKAMEKLQ